MNGMKRLSKRLVFGLVVAAVAGSSVPATVSAQIHPPPPPVWVKNRVDVDNKTHDAGAWVTAYRSTMIGKQIMRAWCVKPGEFSKHTIVGSDIGYVRLEVTNKTCGHPVKLDRTYDFNYKTFVVTGSGGKYDVTFRDKDK
jgi:hypothetical protein